MISRLGRCSQDATFHVPITPNLKEKKRNGCRMMPETNLTEDRAQTKAFVDFRCSPSVVGGLQILLSLLPFTRNLPFTRRPNSCIVVWQQLTCWLVFLASLSWLLIGCSWFKNTGVFVILGYTLCRVSLSTMTAISVDRLLALLLGLRYKQIVTLKRTYLIVATFWVTSIFLGCGIFQITV